ncbi:nuclear transport factor 2 family protein [Variovorax dokdonensis]|uniref:Nuclear transport factor 2 family protein n=1 Tax=Variovorax dokdonensis TaxID=344883 RepID=A0ABT7NAX2_9BURK|nr:nuclear transport factor 2 family protein [Variovorax dokdonensis]MDM0045040.1 nuclear transport factor 2 family protein [Variovorax dokdonensis]
MSNEELRQARLQTVRDHMALECTQDWDGVIDTFEHPRYEMYGNGQVHDGEEEVRRYFDASRQSFPDQKNEIISLAVDDASNTVLVEFYLLGTHLGELKVRDKTYAPTGRQFKVRMAASFQFGPGSSKIICERPYTSPDLKLQQLGLL